MRIKVKVLFCSALALAVSSLSASTLKKVLSLKDENAQFELVEGMSVPELQKMVLEANAAQSPAALLGINALGRKDPRSLFEVVDPIVNGSMDASKVLVLRVLDDNGLVLDDAALAKLTQSKNRVDVRMEAWASLAFKGSVEAGQQAFEVLENYKGPDDVMGFAAAARVFEAGCDKDMEKKLERLALSATGWRRPSAVIAWCSCALKNSKSDKDKEDSLWPALGDQKSDRPRKWALKKALKLEPSSRKGVFDRLLSDPAHPAHHEAKVFAKQMSKSTR